MTAAFTPAGVRFNGRRDVQVLGDDYLDTLAEGDPLANDDLHPVVFTRGETPSSARPAGQPA